MNLLLHNIKVVIKCNYSTKGNQQKRKQKTLISFNVGSLMTLIKAKQCDHE